MPAPIDWTAAGGLHAVQTLTIALGPREAARRLNLSDAHAAALRQLCARGRWLSPEPLPLSPPDVSRPSQPVTRRPPDAPEAWQVLAASRVAEQPVTNPVTTAADAMLEANADNSRRSRSAALRYSARTLEHAADLDGETALASASDVASAVKVASVAGGWGDQDKAKVRVNIFAGQGSAVQVVDNTDSIT